MIRILHIGINFEGSVPKDELKLAFDKALDWVKYASNCWIVKTSSEADVWYHRLKPILNDADTFYIVEIGMSRNSLGFLPKYVWDWLGKNVNTEFRDINALPKPDESGSST